MTPPAMASSQAPWRRCSQASWIAVSDAEHMVSIGMLGPRRSSRYDTRLASDPNEVRGAPGTPSVARGPLRSKPVLVIPANTPTREPCRSARRSRVYPASSSTDQALSTNNRSCGSTSAASRGAMPKNAASKRAKSSRNAPHLL
ncbi:hypothetical protein GCM10027271_40570 [Saccharopolyspora gloriosae]